MGTTAHLWIEDSQGKWVKGNSQIHNRENSIELLSIEHHIHSPFDVDNGQSTSPRKHSPFTIIFLNTEAGYQEYVQRYFKT